MKICLYGAGSKNINDKYLKEGYKLGRTIAENGHELVFGAGNDGMMGAVANGVHDNDGQITGISPEWMDNFEDIYPNCNQILYTKTMKERKNLFLEKSDAFIIAPGGIGTLDEFFDIITLKRLERHNKPVILFNIYNYYDTLLSMLNFMYEENTVPRLVEDIYEVATSTEEAMKIIEGNV